jgi:antitoxin VapB
MTQKAKLFKNGRSQAIRLPAAFRFAESEVYIRRDLLTGDVILSRRPGTWDDFFQLVGKLDVPQDFLADRQDAPPQARTEL